MIYETYVPPEPLGFFVEHLWYHEGYQPDHSAERLLPNGSMELVINLRDGARKLYDGTDLSSYQSYSRSWFSGQQRGFIVIESGSDSSMIGAHFRPGGAAQFLPCSSHELNDSVVHLDSLYGREASQLRDRLLETGSIAGKFRHLELFLLTLGRAGRGWELDPALRYALAQITASPEEVSIGHLAGRIGISQKNLIRKFDRKVGLKPKQLSRVFKFQKVLRMIETCGEVDWSLLACTCGYYDQSHFIKEFKRFSGINPTRYLVEKGDYFNYLPIR